MDKGVKGLLTGDLSVPLIQEMQIKIEGFQVKFERLSNEISSIIEKQETLEQVVSEHFKIDHLVEMDRGVYERNLPKYTTIAQNFQNFLVTLDRKQSNAALRLQGNQDYFSIDQADFSG